MEILDNTPSPPKINSCGGDSSSSDSDSDSDSNSTSNSTRMLQPGSGEGGPSLPEPLKLPIHTCIPDPDPNCADEGGCKSVYVEYMTCDTDAPIVKEYNGMECSGDPTSGSVDGEWPGNFGAFRPWGTCIDPSTIEDDEDDADSSSSNSTNSSRVLLQQADLLELPKNTMTSSKNIMRLLQDIKVYTSMSCSCTEGTTPGSQKCDATAALAPPEPVETKLEVSATIDLPLDDMSDDEKGA